MAKKIAVEPLTDARWARMEQSLMGRLAELPVHEQAREPAPTRLRPRARTMAVVGGFTIAAAAAAIALRVASPLAHPSTSRVVTEASASHVTFGENAIDVSPESGIVVNEEDHATVLTLERGEVALHVAPRPKDRPFLVEAGDVHVRVVGTEFTVRRVGVGATVSVRKGVVEVREHDELTRLTAGQHWPDETRVDATVGSTAAATPTPTLNSTPTPTLNGTPTPNGIATPTPNGIATSTSTSTPTLNATPAATPIAPAIRGASPHASRPRPSLSSASTPSAPSTPAPAAPAASPAPPVDAPLDPPTAPVAAAEPSAQSKFEAAEQVERTDPARALRMYLALAQGSDAWARDALYAAGRLEADRGHRGDAVKLLEDYLRRFPSGTNAQDARALRDSLR
jgi:hypothetical protein